MLKRFIAIAVAVFVCGSVQIHASSKPNFIVIFVDDQGYQDLGCFGSPNIKTPHIDAMAKEGMRFTDFYSAASVCTPSRGALLTARYPDRLKGAQKVLFQNARGGLDPDEVTIADMLKGNGYATACVGKWHLGHTPKHLPTSQGFDSYFGIPYSNDMKLDPAAKRAENITYREGYSADKLPDKRAGKNLVPLMRDEEIIEYPADQHTLTTRYTDESINFITANKDKPFFLYLAHTMPHIPLYAEKEREGTSEAGLYGDCIEEIDDSTGKILDTLKKNGLDKNTFIIYTTDNGPWNLKANATAKVKGNMDRRVGGSALPLRGYKFQRYEGGMRVPTVMWWPGRIPAGKECSEVAGTIDVLPTLAELSGSKLPTERKLDGKSIVSLIEGKEGAKSPHAAYFYRKEAVRRGKWKLIKGELYDLSSDISESENLADKQPEIVSELSALLGAHKEDLASGK